jgi:hypothetical protein
VNNFYSDYPPQQKLLDETLSYLEVASMEVKTKK